ncbi:mitochondrial inner membrane protease subunit 1 isoform X2 [Micropterus dolomieu]|uniref:mitochondrial inner membrane protease subunit 1 isoform X2 n=1 Tax=Micropterus dolomieu TaxID=147949 RepID=UPI001E8EC219|nr:mitochondrial inner membrane protease subunit 1 isoform X2 [Micropterus dolomieu]
MRAAIVAEPSAQAAKRKFNLLSSVHGWSIESLSRGDIVIAKSPFDPHMNICKRVIGLEGDKVCTSSPSDLFKTHTYVPKGHVWLEGDNLRNSTDSRSYGPIPYALIRGRVCLKLWPPHSFGTLTESPTRRIIKTQSDSDSD